VLEQTFYGFYEDASQAPDQPTYDPPHDAPCPFCGGKITADDVRTHSLMYAAASYAKRAYYYRTHRTCSIKHEPLTMDDFILEMIARNGD
jgi:hypothetical protein